MTFPEKEILTAFISPIFHIDDVTAGDPEKDYLYRYRGQLLIDSIPAFDQLLEQLRPHHLTPLFRKEDDGRHTILLTKSLPEAKKPDIRINIILFVLTVFSVMLAGVDVKETPPADTLGLLLFLARNIFTGWPFALSLLSILLAHEFGHYFAARFHKAVATLPFFIPFPSLLGTMGAVIIWQEQPKNKRTLFDVGVAGPLAGLIVSIPVLIYGLSISKVSPIEAPPSGLAGFIEGNSILYLLIKYSLFGQLLPAPAVYNIHPLLYWLRFFFTGQPLPIGGIDVQISMVALAGWAGILVTAINLIPAGQLDGGHVMYVLFGKKLTYALPVLMAIIGLLGIFWNGWWLWVLLLYFFGRETAEPLDQITEIDLPRRVLAWFMLFLFFIVFIPVPMIMLGKI